LPIMATVSSASIKTEDRVNDYIFLLNYENQETGLNIGVAYQTRIAPESGNDAPLGATTPEKLPFGAAKKIGGWNAQNVNVYVARVYPELNYGVEAGFWSGNTGLEDAAGDDIKIDAFVVAAEIDYRNKDSKWSYGLKTGYVSGDNNSTSNTFEGYMVNRNYDIAFLLFNHPLGQKDFLVTGLNKKYTSELSRIDDETLSNVVYVSPSVKWKWTDFTVLDWRLTYALLNQVDSNKNAANDLGVELDFGLSYKPYERVTWLTQFGLFLPGQAFAGGTDNLGTELCYGLNTKIAISF
jgi:hypothetical protein